MLEEAVENVSFQKPGKRSPEASLQREACIDFIPTDVFWYQYVRRTNVTSRTCELSKHAVITLMPV